VACRTEVIASSVLQTSWKTATDKSILVRSERKSNLHSWRSIKESPLQVKTPDDMSNVRT